MLILNFNIRDFLVQILLLTREEWFLFSDPSVRIDRSPSVIDSVEEKIPGVESTDVLVQGLLDASSIGLVQLQTLIML